MSFENHSFALFANFPHPVFLLAPDGTILETNHFFVEIFFSQIGEIRGKNIYDLTATVLNAHEFAAKRKANVDSVFSSGKHLIFDDASPEEGRVFRSSIYPVKSTDGVVTCVLIIVHDVTEQVETERRARHTDHIYKALLDAIPAAVFILDDEFLLISSNHYAFNLFGDRKGEIKNNNFFNLVFREDRGRLKKILTDIMESGHEEAKEVRMHTLDDRNNFNWFNIHAQKTIIDNRNYLVLACFDIQHIKISQSHLFEYKKWLIKAIKAGNAGVWVWNMATNDGTWSDTIWELFGIEKKPGNKLTIELWLSAIHPDDREMIVESVNRAISLKADMSIEYRVLRPDGSCRWILDVGKPFCDKYGELKSYSGTTIDITDYKTLDNEKNLIREQIDLLLEQLNVGWFHMNLKTNSTIRTFEHARIFGYDSIDSDWSFEKFLEHVVDEERERVRDTLFSSISGKNDFLIDCHIRKTTGEKRRIHAAVSLIRDEHEKPTYLVGIVQDITDLYPGVQVESRAKIHDETR